MRMIAFAAVIAGWVCVAGVRTVGAPNPPINVLAESVQQDGRVTRLDGHVRIAACGVVTTEHATAQNREFELSGPAHLRPTNPVDPLR